MNGDAWLFSYGTLQDPEVQRRLFGRELPGEADALTGFCRTTVEIDGTNYWSLVPEQAAGERIEGRVLRVTEAELAIADAYEGATDYVRLEVTLESGRQAFVYVSTGE